MAKTITDILVSQKILTADEASKVKKEAKEKKISLDEALYAHGITETDVAEAKSTLTGFPTKFLAGGKVAFETLRDIPEESARHYKMVPLGKKEGYFEVGVLAPDDVATGEAIKFIASRVNMPARIFIITLSDFQSVMQEYQGLSGEVTTALGEFEKEYEALGEEIKIRKETASVIVEEAPVTKMMAVILRHAVDGRASDIHIEPSREKLRVRFRVDGVLYTSLLLPQKIHPALVTRIKVMTNMKIDETRIPQDGRFHAKVSGKEIDLRVSTFPISEGEKVAIRILDPEAGIKELPMLGVERRNLTLIEENIKKPFGLILITGPTGSGKSTTLYAIMRLLNKEKVNIVSVEDPIEYYIGGVNQSQIRPEIGYTFAAGVRNILRQDPDIIMVGEIRDKETAAMAIHAALTGHIVLSTLHTNNVIGVIPRLIDMGVDPYLIPSTLILAIGQRLVQRLCKESKKRISFAGKIKEMIEKEIKSMPRELKEQMEKEPMEFLYESEVGPTCPRGTRGRMGIFEVMAMTPELEQIILRDPSENSIAEEALRQGMTTMRQDGILKVLRGEIGLKELLEII